MKWASKSVLIGALASGIDLAIGTFFAVGMHFPTRVCTAIGLCFGATINFLAQRRYAFPDRDTRLGHSTLRWLLVTAAQILVHGQLVTLLRDQLHVPYVPAKMAGDVLVFTVLQLVLLRYVIFPARRAARPSLQVGAVETP
ncbi:MAG: GtrA family protein [Archangiaceae bacterium]|nr:GtrA family protein [Archangiaceae bacterium]